MNLSNQKQVSHTSKSYWVIILSVVLLLSSYTTSAATSYTTQGYFVELLDDLPEQYGGHSIRDINAMGQIAGEARGDTGTAIAQAVVWDNDTSSITNIDGNKQVIYSTAHGINDAGHVVGHFNERAAIWLNGQRSFILNAQGNSFGGRAYDINNSGTIIGRGRVIARSGPFVINGLGSFIVQNGTLSILEDLTQQQSTLPSAINDLDQITGNSIGSSSSPNTRAVIWTDGLISLLPINNDVTESFANSINDSAMVVGYAHNGDHYLSSRAVLWHNDSMIELASLGGTRSYAEDINNQGDIIGNSLTSTGLKHPVLWKNGIITDLYPLLEDLCPSALPCIASARVINDAGQIAGLFYMPGIPGTPAFRGTLQSFRITPIGN